MTLNLGTAAYMAPELSSLTKWVSKFGTDDNDVDVVENASMGHQEKESILAGKHIEAVNSFDLSSTKPSTSGSQSASHGDDAVRTSKDLASKATQHLNAWPTHPLARSN